MYFFEVLESSINARVSILSVLFYCQRMQLCKCMLKLCLFSIESTLEGRRSITVSEQMCQTPTNEVSCLNRDTQHLPAFHFSFVCLGLDYRRLVSMMSSFKQDDSFVSVFLSVQNGNFLQRKNRVSGAVAKTNDIIIDIMTDSIKQKMFWRKQHSFIFCQL